MIYYRSTSSVSKDKLLELQPIPSPGFGIVIPNTGSGNVTFPRPDGYNSAIGVATISVSNGEKDYKFKVRFGNNPNAYETIHYFLATSGNWVCTGATIINPNEIPQFDALVGPDVYTQIVKGNNFIPDKIYYEYDTNGTLFVGLTSNPLTTGVSLPQTIREVTSGEIVSNFSEKLNNMKLEEKIEELKTALNGIDSGLQGSFIAG